MTGLSATNQERAMQLFKSRSIKPVLFQVFTLIMLVSSVFLPAGNTFSQEAPQLVITRIDDGILLEWNVPEGQSRWIILNSSDPYMRQADTLAICSSPSFIDRRAFSVLEKKQFYQVLPWFAGSTPEAYEVVEDFELGEVNLLSYQEEDVEPESVEIIEGGPEESQFQLKMYGNSWKVQPIDPKVIDFSTVWSIDVFHESMSTRQMIGFGDGEDVMFYGLWGASLSPRGTDTWIMTYLGWYEGETWQRISLPIGQDWHGRFNNFGPIDRIIYVNDNDGRMNPGTIYFDNLRDATGSQPIPPEASFNWMVESSNQDSISYQFYNLSQDDDSDNLTYRWSFGDGKTSREEHPIHTYPRGGKWPVALSVNDDGTSWDYHVETLIDSPLVRQSDFTISCVGDVVYRGGYASQIDDYGYNYPLELVADYIRAADLSICNLENPMTDSNTPHPTKGIVFRARPEDTESLVRAGYDFVTLANNHVFDQLEPGMYETMSVLDDYNILWGGVGRNDVQARQIVQMAYGGKSIGIISMCNRDGHYNTANQPYGPQPFLDAGRDRPGFAFWSRSNIEATVPQAAEDCDIVMIQSHSGSEYSRYPRDGEKYNVEYVDEIEPGDDFVTFELHPDSGEVALRHYAIDLGADVVVCHHPHIIQGVEIYNGKLIVHSLGNFLMDLDRNDCNLTMVAEIHVNNDSIDAAVLRPAFIGRDGRPSIVHGEQASNILDYLTYYSDLLNTSLIRLPGEDIGHVYWERETTTTQEEHEGTYYWYSSNDEFRSRPIKLTGEGYITRAVFDNPPGGNMQYRVGRDILMWANNEDEGIQPWDLNSNYEYFDDERAHDGERSLKINIDDNGPNNVTVDFHTRLRLYPEYPHSFLGWINTSNATDALYELRYHNGNGNLTASSTPSVLNGDFNWNPVFEDFDQMNGDQDYLNVRLSMNGPIENTAEAWFDDMAYIWWEEWQDLDAENGLDLEFPNGYRFIQFRTDENPGTDDLMALNHQGNPDDELDEAGGPDDYGYVYLDSQEEGGPQYDWVDITGTGTAINNMEDDSYQGPFDLPFGFEFYGNTYDEVYIGSNGYISFGGGSGVWRNGFIPNDAEPNNIICLFRDDLNPETNGTIYYGTDTDGNWVCEYYNISEFGAGGQITAEIILKPDGEIVFQYFSLTNNIVITEEYVGIENIDGSTGLLISNRSNPANYPFGGLAIQITPPVMNASVSGRVVDNETNLPIAGASVRFGGFQTVTDDNGSYSIDELFSQTYNVSINAEGYFVHTATVEVVEGVNVYDVSLVHPPSFHMHWTNEWPIETPQFRGIIEGAANQVMR